MCRLFGYRSLLCESLEKPLLAEENSLFNQSKEHRDGWGLAYFNHGAPHIVKSKLRAGDDADFLRLAKNVQAPTVIGHLRRATQGEISLLNCHPFQFGPWVFAHNGDLPDFASTREQLAHGIAPIILEQVYGNTDSEMYFALFLNELHKEQVLSETRPPIQVVAHAFRRAVARIEKIYEDRQVSEPYALNAIVSNGDLFLAYRQGHSLHYRADREPVARLIVCSEQLSKASNFIELNDRQLIGIDDRYEFFVHL